MYTNNLRKISGVLAGVAAIILYILGFSTLSGISQDQMRAIHAGNGSATPFLLGAVYLILASALFLVGRVLFGADGHPKSRTAAAITLATLPIQKLLLTGLKYYITCFSDLSKKISEMFVHNTGFLEIVLIVLSLGVGVFAAASKRVGEYGTRSDSKVESNVKAGLLGMLGMQGYDIADVILTTYDGQKTAILIFESEAAWDLAIEKGYDQEILAACQAAEPDYDYRFEYKS